jgi:hypothetical protein
MKLNHKWKSQFKQYLTQDEIEETAMTSSGINFIPVYRQS